MSQTTATAGHGLNAEQTRAVYAPDGPLIIIAGPGSGKTRVVTHRIAHLIRDREMPPHRIVAITFTNRAAREMQERLTGMLGDPGRDVRASTFHRFCGRLLREYHELAGVQRDYSIYDRDDQVSVLNYIMPRLATTPEERSTHATSEALKAIGYAKANLLTPDDLQRDLKSGRYRGPRHYRSEFLSEAYREYEARMRANNAIDLDDMILRTVQILDENPHVRNATHRRFRHIMIDEFQDTNPAQYRLAQLVTGPQRNLCVVGDPDQSIYGWRHADINNILNFRDDYPDATEVRLGSNYRSTDNIVTAAERMIRRNKARIDNPLQSMQQAGAPIEVLQHNDENHEAENVIQWLLAQAEDLKVPLNECAVMYRLHRIGRAVEEECVHQGIPYRMAGGVRFYDRAEIRDCIAYLRLIHNPADSAAFQRVVNKPARGLGAVSVSKIMDWAERHGHSCLQAIELTTLSVEPPPNDLGLTKPAVAKAGEFARMMQRLADASRTTTLPDLFDLVLQTTNIEESIRKAADGEERWDNVLGIHDVCAQMDDQQPAANGSLEQMLETVTLMSQVDETNRPDGITLTTLHQAKGLEWEAAAIIAVEESLLPFWMEDNIEEERRLCYVGVTRAKSRLALSWADTRGLRYADNSRFIDELEA